ncbi:MAG: TIGR00725 family protein [Chloroflexota bacterium]|nr:TIGR00725 family protein [Dehalococcoidia bacterium]MDW8253984.1 TIGR00725 family protein [Chloroflexota bacterium]
MIAVIGDSLCDAATAATAEEVGRRLAEAGVTVVCGGLGGVMEAACRGAKAAGGQTVGILPGDRANDANPFVDIAIVTGMGEARNVLVVKSADGAIAVGGRYGTLSEIALALKLGKPVVGIRSWQLATAAGPDTGLVPADSPADAVALILAMIAGGNARG